MKKLSAYIVLLVFVAIYAISASDKLTWIIAQARFYANTWWASDKTHYGDLYGKTFLPRFKDPQLTQKYATVSLERYSLSGKKVLNMYAIHDSYMMRVMQGKMDSLIQGINNYTDIKWWNNLNRGKESYAYIKIDTSKFNVLLLEITERNIRQVFESTKLTYTKLRDGNQPTETVLDSATGLAWYRQANSFPTSAIEENLQFNVFDYHIFAPIREIAAYINERWFGRLRDNVVTISNDGNYLYLAATVGNHTESSLSELTDKEVGIIINTLNKIYDHYKSLGFNEVYFAPIPSPVSIVNTEIKKYNGLIPRIENSTDLKMPVIDIYSIYKNTPYKVYSKGESHWTVDGLNLWVNLLNKTLSSRSKEILNK